MINLKTEFDKQVQNLIDRGYPKYANMSSDKFVELLEPLKEKLESEEFYDIDFNSGYLPFVIVISSDLLDSKQMMSLTSYNDKPGVDIMRPREPKDFKTIRDVQTPKTPAYLIVNVERGKEFLNVIPSEAKKTIFANNRSPLTIAEGIAIITQYPDFLQKNNCFSLLASRFEGDQRVPAIWINGHKEANLGWCWDGNPHTWLGSASCLKRI